MTLQSDPTLKWSEDWLRWFDKCKKEERNEIEFDFMLFDIQSMHRHIYLQRFSKSDRINKKNLSFFEEVELFKMNYETMRPEGRCQYFEDVYRKFLMMDKTSSETIHIDAKTSETLAKLYDRLQKADTTTEIAREVFDNALKEIYGHLKTDVYPRFLRSDDFKGWRENGLKRIVHKFFQAVTTETPNSDSSLFTFLTWLSKSGIMSYNLFERARQDYFTAFIHDMDKILPADNKEIENFPIGTVIFMADQLFEQEDFQQDSKDDDDDENDLNIFAVLVVVPGRNDPAKKDLVGANLGSRMFKEKAFFSALFSNKADHGSDYIRLPASELRSRNEIAQSRGTTIKAVYFENVLEIVNRFIRKIAYFERKQPKLFVSRGNVSSSPANSVLEDRTHEALAMAASTCDPTRGINGPLFVRKNTFSTGKICYDAVMRWLYLSGYTSKDWYDNKVLQALKGLPANAPPMNSVFLVRSLLGTDRAAPVAAAVWGTIPRGWIWTIQRNNDDPDSHWGVSLGNNRAVAVNNTGVLRVDSPFNFITGSHTYGTFIFSQMCSIYQNQNLYGANMEVRMVDPQRINYD